MTVRVDAYFHPIRMTNPVHPGLSLPQNIFVQDRRNNCPLSWIPAAVPPWGKLSNLWTPCVYSLRLKVPSWIWIRWIQYATHRNNFTSPPKLAISTAMQNSAPTPSYFISGQHFLETFTNLPKQPEPQTRGWLHHSCP